MMLNNIRMLLSFRDSPEEACGPVNALLEAVYQQCHYTHRQVTEDGRSML
ncbi:MAG: hypothetical protein FPO08_07775 [Geobacter sp.]|nr:MAG: hypothetical protein FPO08_07775 [Geobacter sp.]